MISPESPSNNNEETSEGFSTKNHFKMSEEEITNDIKRKERIEDIDKFLSSLPEDTFMKGMTQGSFSSSLYYHLKDKPEVLSTVRKKLEGEVLVDLGVGEVGHDDGWVEELDIPLKAFVGVDLQFSSQHESNLEYAKDNRSFNLDFVKEDMLKFVASLPDESANFMISGITDSVIQNLDYFKRLREEITRATKESGLLIRIRSQVGGAPEEFRTIHAKDESYSGPTPSLLILEKG